MSILFIIEDDKGNLIHFDDAEAAAKWRQEKGLESKIRPGFSSVLWEHLFFLKMHPDQLFENRDKLEQIPYEAIEHLAKKKFLRLRQLIKYAFVNGGVDLEKYPKIRKAFQFDELDLTDYQPI